MRRRGIQSFFINKRLPFYLAGIIFLVSQWIKKEPDEYLFFGITSFIHLGIAALLLYMNQLFTIIRQRTNIHPVIYLLLASIVVSPDKLALSLSSLAVYLSIMLLFASFQDTRSQGRIFIIAVLISIASLFFNPILYLFPFFWLGMYRLQCLSLKTFLAGILGILMIALFLFTWAVFNNDLSLFVHLLPDYRALINFNIPDFTALNISDYIISGITIFLFILSIIGGVMSVGSEKIRTSANLSALIILLVLSFILIFIQTEYQSYWTSVFAIPASILTGRYFTLSHKRISSVLMLTTILVLIIAVFLI